MVYPGIKYLIESWGPASRLVPLGRWLRGTDWEGGSCLVVLIILTVDSRVFSWIFSLLFTSTAANLRGLKAAWDYTARGEERSTREKTEKIFLVFILWFKYLVVGISTVSDLLKGF